MNENDLNQEIELTENDTVENTADEENSTTDDSVDYKALFEQSEAEKKKLKRKLYIKEPTINKPKQEEQDDLAKTVKRLAMIEEKRQFQFEHGLSPEETDAVFKFSNGKPSKDTLEHPFVKAGIESLRTAQKVANNTPSSSQRSSAFGGKSFSELSEAERAKAFEQRVTGFK